jgi:hypothetical protein
MKTNKTVLAVSSLLCLSWAAQARDSGAASPDPNAQTVVVARIGDSVITKEELIQRLLQEIRPRDEEFTRQAEPVTAAGLLRRMVGEKAMSLEGRRRGYLQDEQIRPHLVQFEQQLLVRRLMEDVLDAEIPATDAEIDQVVKSNPKATREQAKMVVQRAKATRIMEQFYARLIEKRKLTIVRENLAKAAAIHQRLLLQPVIARGPGEYWIKNSQVIHDLSDDEKEMTLAAFDGGRFTLRDWFQALCNVAPPRRPRDLDKPEGVEKLLNNALRLPVLAAEARFRGFDKDVKLRSEVRRLEDQRLQYKTQEERMQEIREPTEDEIRAVFEKDPQRFATRATLKVDQIWCEDLETARKVKAMLADGADFPAVKKAHSLQKDIEVYTVYPGSEGLFWPDLWQGEPNEVLGPLRGFYDAGVKWRVVKILEKTPAQVQPWSEQLAGTIKWVLYGERRQQALREYEKELLAKYPHEVFSERIRDMDPLEIAMNPPSK